MQAYQENISAKVSGVLSPILGVSVTVTDTATGLPATLYSDNGVTQIAQPLVTDETGYFGFYAANGSYTVKFSSPQIAVGTRVIELYDRDDDAPMTQAQAASPTGASGVGYGQRTVANKLDDVLSVKDFGAKGDGVTIDTLALRTAFAAGGNIYVPPGTYLLDNTLIWTVSRDTRIVCAAGAILKGTANFPVDNKFLMPSTDGSLRTLTWEGGTLDGRLRPPRSVGAPDLFYISDSNFRRVHIDRLHFLSNDDYAGTAGDSGLFLAEGEDYHVTNCTFQGCIDAGLYISGDNTLTKGRRIHTDNNTFLFCSVGIISKRLFEDHVLNGSIVFWCGTGIVVGGEGSATQGAGRKAVISNSIIRHVERGIETRLADGTIISDNRIEDFGISMAGTIVADHAIVIAGSNHCSVSINNISLTGAYVPSSLSAAINIDVRAFNGTTYQGNINLVSTNTIDNVARGIVENGTCDYNTLTGNQITNTTTRYTVVGAHTVYRDMDPVAGTQRTRWGSSGQATPVSGATVIHEDDTDIIHNYLAPSSKSIQWIVGNEANNAIGRFGYGYAANTWTWRAGGSGVVFTVRSDGPAFGTVASVTTETVTGYITIHDNGGTARKLAVIS